jgi:trehalose-phosphatase
VGDLDLILGRLCRVVHSGRPLALLFDYDGTLAPIRPKPTEAILPPAIHRALKRLSANPSVSLGVLSGRALDDLRATVEIDDLYYAGTSGLEIDLRGKVLKPPGVNAARAPLDQIAGRLADVAAMFPGAWLEQKPLGLTLHYRAIAERQIPRLRVEAAEAIVPWASRLRIEDVTLGLEVVPEVGWDKGTAVRAILEELDTDVFPVYAGDSANDLPALAAVDEAGGLSIGVGAMIQHTGAWLNGPGAIGAMIIMLAVAVHDADCLMSATR